MTGKFLVACFKYFCEEGNDILLYYLHLGVTLHFKQDSYINFPKNTSHIKFVVPDLDSGGPY